MFQRIKRYYDKGLYSKGQVAKFLEKGFISTEEYEEITGERYDEQPAND